LDNLAGLRPGNHAFKVSIFAALEFTFAAFSNALSAPLFLGLLLLSSNALS